MKYSAKNSSSISESRAWKGNTNNLASKIWAAEELVLMSYPRDRGPRKYKDGAIESCGKFSSTLLFMLCLKAYISSCKLRFPWKVTWRPETLKSQANKVRMK